MNSSNEPAEHLFERLPSEGYLLEWTDDWINQPSGEEVKNSLSVLVFRLGDEFLAIQTSVVKEVARGRPVHRIPHRSGNILLGLVNLNGELQICVAMHHLLEVQPLKEALPNKTSHLQERMIAIAKEGELWVFPVDGIKGIFNWNFADLENVPVNISKSKVNYIKAIMKIQNMTVGLLDEELLFPSLKRSLL